MNWIGATIISDGTGHIGTVTNVVDRHCGCGCNIRLSTKWNDGKRTFLCPKGLEIHKDGTVHLPK